VDDDRHIRIADFGLCGFAHSTRNEGAEEPGNKRWMAELLTPMLDHFDRTFETDVYSFAMVCIEVRVARL
jgi:hypothetical protein